MLEYISATSDNPMAFNKDDIAICSPPRYAGICTPIMIILTADKISGNPEIYTRASAIGQLLQRLHPLLRNLEFNIT